jgi:hypothetical protein
LNDFIKAVLIVSIIFLATGITGSFIYNGNDEAATESLFRGLYLNTPVSNIDYGFKGISFLYVFLYAKIDLGVNYFGISLILLNWLAFVLLIFILLKKGPANKVFWSIVFLLLGFYTIFIVSLTTTCILASFAAQLLFIYALTDIKSPKIKCLTIFISSCIIIFTYLMRPTSGTLAFILFVPILVWHILFNFKGYRKLLPMLVILPFLLSIALERKVIPKLEGINKHNNDFLQICAKLVDYGYTLNIQNKNQEKLLFEVNNWFFADKETQSIVNYNNLLVPPARINDFSIRNIKITLHYIAASIFNRRSLPYISLIIIALFILYLFKVKNIKVLIIFLSIGYLFAVLVAISLLMKMPAKVLIPTLLIAVFYLLTTIPSFFRYNKQEINKFILIILVLTFATLLFYQARCLANDLSREKQNASICLKELNKYLNSEKTENVFMTWAYDFNYYPLKHIKWNPGVKLIPLFGWMSYYPQTYSYLQALTGSNDIKDIFKWIAAHPDKAAIYSDKDNNLVLKKIFAYHDIRADLLPTKILNKELGKGFYRVSFNEL